jgi:hypothetical protein
MPFADLKEFKEHVQGTFDSNDESLQRYGETYSPQLKTYLIETNHAKPDKVPFAEWKSFPEKGWFGAQDKEGADWVLDASQPRVWRLFSLSRAEQSDKQVDAWLNAHEGLDYCWLTRPYLLAWQKREGWMQRGVGLRFQDGLAAQDHQERFSMKAWYGAAKRLNGLGDVLREAQEQFAIHSTRWQKLSGQISAMSVELYSSGKVTVNTARDVDDALNFSQELVVRYREALNEASTKRSDTFAPFELDFKQEIDLDGFAEKVARAAAPMKLWLVETERPQEDFRRFKGVDLHTWDRIFLDVGPTFAYLTIPGKGCVNAAPRLATLQGEDNAGKTEIYHDGVPIFA